MQAAFGFAEAGPAAGSWVFAREDGAGAVGATDAGIIAVVQGVVGDFVAAYVGPHPFASPVGRGEAFHQIEFLGPVGPADLCTGLGPDAAGCGKPELARG